MFSCLKNLTNDRISAMIEELQLHEYQKTLLKNRFLDQVVLYDKKAKSAEFFYILFNIFITVGSIILPALLSIQQMDYSNDDKKDERIQITIYWLTWAISLLITICNGLVQLLALNKQYLSFTRTREKLLSEGWYYFQLTGDYKDTTHKDAFHDFCEEIEKIKEEQVDKELSFMQPKKKKNGDPNHSIASGQGTTQNQGQGTNQNQGQGNNQNQGQRNTQNQGQGIPRTTSGIPRPATYESDFQGESNNGTQGNGENVNININ